MADKEINITYETLFELLRREKTREELQKLDAEFFKDVVNYLNEKRISLDALRAKTDLFAAEEKLRAEKQMHNTNKIIKEIYERREKKIICLALDSSRTFSMIDCSAMLAEEKKIFDCLLCAFNKFRKEILISMLEAKQPNIIEEMKPVQPVVPDSSTPQPVSSIQTPDAKPQTPNSSFQTPNPKPQTPETMIIRFLYPVPKFLGKTLEEYGPFDKDDVANIPYELADLLVSKGRAEKLQE